MKLYEDGFLSEVDSIPEGFVFEEQFGVWFKKEESEYFWLEEEGNYSQVFCPLGYMEDNFNQCVSCGDWTDSVYEDSEGSPLCLGCYEDKYVVCSECGEVSPIEDCIAVNEEWVCQSCINDHYHQCEECGRYIHEGYEFYDNYGRAICEDCYEESSKSGWIAGYHEYPRNFKFKSLNSTEDHPLRRNKYMGVEIELSGVGEDNNNLAKSLTENYDVICMYDGSVNNGFEVITDAMTFLYHKQKFDWGSLIDEAADEGFYPDRTVGLHVHVSRTDMETNDIARIVEFVYHNYDSLMLFGNRSETGFCGKPCLQSTPEDWVSTARDHYCAINTKPSKDIEFRFANSTDNVHHLYAVLEFCDAITEVCKGIDRQISWNDIYTYSKENENHEYLCDEIDSFGFREVEDSTCN